jgi:hypothetical protein
MKDLFGNSVLNPCHELVALIEEITLKKPPPANVKNVEDIFTYTVYPQLKDGEFIVVTDLGGKT